MAELRSTAYDSKIDGDGCVPVRYRAVRRGSDAILAATMRRDDCCRHSHIQNGAGGETNLRANARAKMGDRHGCVRLHRRHVSLLRRSARDRSTFAGRCLHFRLPATTRSAAGRLDETAGENFARALIQKSKTRIDRKTSGRAYMRSEFSAAQRATRSGRRGDWGDLESVLP